MAGESGGCSGARSLPRVRPAEAEEGDCMMETTDMDDRERAELVAALQAAGYPATVEFYRRGGRPAAPPPKRNDDDLPIEEWARRERERVRRKTQR